MSNSNSTSIDDLPSNELGNAPQQQLQQQSMPNSLQPISTSVHDSNNGGNNNINVSVQQPTSYNPNSFSLQQPQLTQNTDAINQIMSTINIAGNKLPSRDIPMSIPQDTQSRPNYIPQQQQTNNQQIDYVNFANNYAEIASKHKEAKEKEKTSDDFFDKLQIPIICGILFFICQLPVVRKTMFKYLPSLFFSDGNPKLTAMITQTIIFVLGIYILNNFIIVKFAD